MSDLKFPKKTIQEWAKDAIQVQDACNPSGVIYALARALDVVNEESRRLGQGTDWVANHPVIILFVSKIESMVHSERSLRFSDALAACERLAKGGTDVDQQVKDR